MIFILFLEQQRSIQKDFCKFKSQIKKLRELYFFVMKTPKKPINKSPQVDPEDEMEDIQDETTGRNNYDDDDDDFDLPLDDLDTFDNYGSDDDDDDY